MLIQAQLYWVQPVYAKDLSGSSPLFCIWVAVSGTTCFTVLPNVVLYYYTMWEWGWDTMWE